MTDFLSLLQTALKGGAQSGGSVGGGTPGASDPWSRLLALKNMQTQQAGSAGASAGQSSYRSGIGAQTNPAIPGIASGQAAYGAGQSVSTPLSAPQFADGQSGDAYQRLLRFRGGQL